MATNKGKGGPVSKVQKTKILKGLKFDIENSNGDISLEYENLASKYKTTRQTISKYIDELYLAVPEDDIEKTFIDFRMIFAKLNKHTDIMLSEAITIRDRVEVIKTYLLLMEKKTDLLERYFKKDKAADKVQLEANITQKQFIINYNIPNGSDRITDNN